MATLTLTRQFPDGDVINIRIKVDASYPDAINEAKAALMAAYAEVMSELTPSGDGE